MSTKQYNHNDVKIRILDSRVCSLVEKAACPGEAGQSWGQVQIPPCCVWSKGQGGGLAHKRVLCVQGFRECYYVLL